MKSGEIYDIQTFDRLEDAEEATVIDEFTKNLLKNISENYSLEKLILSYTEFKFSGKEDEYKRQFKFFTIMFEEKIIFIREQSSKTEIESKLQYEIESNEIKFFNKLLGEHNFKGIDLLDTFNQLRTFIENNGFLILVNGARRNVWASGMLRDMTNGISTYVLDNENREIVNIFNSYVTDIVVYEEQKKFHDKWRADHGNKI